MFTKWKQRVFHYRDSRKRFLIAGKRGMPVYETYYFHKGEQYLYIGLCMFITLFLSMFFYRSIWAILPLSPIGVKCYLMIEKGKGEKRRRQLETEFKDCILAVSANLRAGYAVENAFIEAVSDMQALYGDNGLMCKELYHLKKGLGNNQPLEKLLLELGKRSKSSNISSGKVCVKQESPRNKGSLVSGGLFLTVILGLDLMKCISDMHEALRLLYLPL